LGLGALRVQYCTRNQAACYQVVRQDNCNRLLRGRAQLLTSECNLNVIRRDDVQDC